MQAEVVKVDLSAATLLALPPQRRYVLALAGHVFNELTLLRKCLLASIQPPGEPSPTGDASVLMSMFFLRLLASKLHEAAHSLTRPAVAEVLRAEYFTAKDGLQEAWDDAIAKYQSRDWIGKIRNQGGFHYLKPTQWEPHLDADVCTDAHVFIGRKLGNSLFHWSEMAVSLPAMRYVNPAAPFEGLELMVRELIQLANQLATCLSYGVQDYLQASGVGAQVTGPIYLDAPPAEAGAMHYFLADEPPQPK